MRDIDKLNALINPIGYGEQVQIDGATYTVSQNIDGHWFLRTLERPNACVSGSQVDFIANIIAFRDKLESNIGLTGEAKIFQDLMTD